MPKAQTNTCKYCHKTHAEMTRVYTNLLRILRKDLTTATGAKRSRIKNGIATAEAYLAKGERACRYKTAA